MKFLKERNTPFDYIAYYFVVIGGGAIYLLLLIGLCIVGFKASVLFGVLAIVFSVVMSAAIIAGLNEYDYNKKSKQDPWRYPSRSGGK